MSRGPGQLQKAILSQLEKHPHPVLQNVLLWEIALERKEFEKTGETFRLNGEVIEEGRIRKSFEISFRRAAKNCSAAGLVYRNKAKITSLDEFIQLLPFITTRLEIFKLRFALLPMIRKYIESNPSTNLDPFEYQLEILEDENLSAYKELKSSWEKIERDILKLLGDRELRDIDLWLDNLCWGRYHFRGRKGNGILRIPSQTETDTEEEIVNQLRSLVERIKTFPEFKIGNAKKVLYALFEAPRHGKTKLTKDFRNFLFNEKEELIKSLPGDQEPATSLKYGRYHDNYLERRKFSPLLDQLFDRHIFRELTFIRSAAYFFFKGMNVSGQVILLAFCPICLIVFLQ